ncbi:ABC transporter permease [Persicirhabdus sediminis]|uniref:ABC transporter permease n=1 Tax=Persicirhabdus sediminis TaxID=454144 RepID=A0A8J7SJ41_9BACT|nr:ABC transporter permease [Persicirhabdus sediminis]MBK1791084.1 ABC transporter permease [Persicirhabdus sediminis]
MRTFLILFRKELNGYFFTPFGWVVLSMVMLMQGFSLSTAMERVKDYPVQENFILTILNTPNFWFYFLFIFPLITMRLFAEEVKTGTMETLLTAPIKLWQVVLSKYTATCVFYAILWLPMLLHLKIFRVVIGSKAPYADGHIYGMLGIVMLIGFSFIAIGCFASTLTSSQIVAGIVTIGMLVILFFLGYIPQIIGDGYKGVEVFHYIGIQQQLSNFSKGLIDSRPIVYHLSLAAFLLFLTHAVLNYRRWKA